MRQTTGIIYANTIEAKINQPFFKDRINFIQESSLQGAANILGIKRNYVKLVFFIHPDLVLGSLRIFLVFIDAEVFNKKATIQIKIRIPDF